jgi:hypothetical protein
MEQQTKEALEKLYNHARAFVHEYEKNEASLDGELTTAAHTAITVLVEESQRILEADRVAVRESEFLEKAS